MVPFLLCPAGCRAAGSVQGCGSGCRRHDGATPQARAVWRVPACAGVSAQSWSLGAAGANTGEKQVTRPSFPCARLSGLGCCLLGVSLGGTSFSRGLRESPQGDAGREGRAFLPSTEKMENQPAPPTSPAPLRGQRQTLCEGSPASASLSGLSLPRVSGAPPCGSRGPTPALCP